MRQRVAKGGWALAGNMEEVAGKRGLGTHSCAGVNENTNHHSTRKKRSNRNATHEVSKNQQHETEAGVEMKQDRGHQRTKSAAKTWGGIWRAENKRQKYKKKIVRQVQKAQDEKKPRQQAIEGKEHPVHEGEIPIAKKKTGRGKGVQSNRESVQTWQTRRKSKERTTVAALKKLGGRPCLRGAHGGKRA